MINLFRLEGQRYNQLAPQPVGRACRHHADHRVRLAIHANLLADDVALSAQPLPKAVHKNDDMIFAGLAFFRQEVAP